MQELTEASEGRTSEKRGSLSRASGEEKRDCGEQIRKPESFLTGQRALQKEENRRRQNRIQCSEMETKLAWISEPCEFFLAFSF